MHFGIENSHIVTFPYEENFNEKNSYKDKTLLNESRISLFMQERN